MLHPQCQVCNRNCVRLLFAECLLGEILIDFSHPSSGIDAEQINESGWDRSVARREA